MTGALLTSDGLLGLPANQRMPDPCLMRPIIGVMLGVAMMGCQGVIR